MKTSLYRAWTTRRVLGAALLLVGMQSLALAEDCGSLQSHYGPFDFRKDRPKLPVVENRHFTPKIKSLLGGETAVTPGPDLEYTLKTFPNHAPALATVVRWAKLKKSPHPKDLHYSVDCHFDRALRFRPDDTVVRMLFAKWLGETNRRDAALDELKRVVPGDNPMTVYNLGLVYAELGAYDEALSRAHEAERLGFAPGALQQMLEKAGQWRPAAPAAPASSAASAAS